jgi:energy-coupling factor transporter transmembrane protein EcfT
MFQQTSQLAIQNYLAPVGFASLANIVVGLIVTWAGYIKGVRWTWFVMFVIAWVWAFPVLLLPYLQHWGNMVPITEWLPIALRESGPQRDFAEAVLTLLLMVLALALPVKTFFLRRADGHD